MVLMALTLCVPCCRSQCTAAIRKEYVVVGQGFKNLADVFKEAADGDSIKLSMAVSNASFCMDDMAMLWKEQPQHDQRPWIDGLTEYGSMLTQFGDAVQSSKEAEARVQVCHLL